MHTPFHILFVLLIIKKIENQILTNGFVYISNNQSEDNGKCKKKNSERSKG